MNRSLHPRPPLQPKVEPGPGATGENQTPVLSRWARQAEGRAGHAGGIVTAVSDVTHWALFLPHVGAWQSPGTTGLEHGRNVPSHQEEAGSGPYKGRETPTRSSSPITFQSLGSSHSQPALSEDPKDEDWFFRHEILSTLGSR